MLRARRSLRLLAGAIALAATLAAAAPAPAQPEAPGQAQGVTLTGEELDALIETLESPEQREEFLARLRALRAAQTAGAERPEGESAGAALLRGISDRLAAAGSQVIALAESLAKAPRFFGWLSTNLGDPATRARWLDILGDLGIVLAAAIAASLILHRVLRRIRRGLEELQPRSVVVRAPYLLGYIAVTLVPLGAFAAAGYGVLTIIAPQEVARLVALAAVNARIVARLSNAASAFVLSPFAPGLRLVGLGDETAVYLHFWISRLINIGVYGYFAAQVALLLGLPEAGYSALIKLLGLVVVALLIVLVLQNRIAVAEWMRGAPAERRRVDFGALRRRLADFWHILAILYVVAGGLFSLAEGVEGFLFLLRASAVSLAILWGVGLALAGIRRVVERGFRVREETRARYPRLEERVNRYLPLVRWVLQAVTLIVAFVLLLQAWNVDALGWLASDIGRIVIARVVSVLLIALAGLVIWEVASSMIDRYLTSTDEKGEAILRSARARTLLPLLRNALRVVIGVVAGLMILAQIGVNIGPILAGVGIIGLAVGFGAQTLVKDVITGVFILLENSLAVGDVVEAGGRIGLVEGMTIRTIRLRDLSGHVHTVPFSSVDTVSNWTKEFSYYVFDVGVGYREDTDEVVEVLREVGREMQADPEFEPHILAPLEILGVDSFADSAVMIKARFKTRPLKQWLIGREFNRRMKIAFDERGIEIPFPHRTIYFGVDKEGSAPPARVAMETPAFGRVEPKAAEGKARPEPGEAGKRREPAPQEPAVRPKGTPSATPGQDEGSDF